MEIENSEHETINKLVEGKYQVNHYIINQILIFFILYI